MITELRWEKNHWDGINNEWWLMAGKLKIVRVVPGNNTGRWCVVHWMQGSTWFDSLDTAKRAAEKLAGAAQEDKP